MKRHAGLLFPLFLAASVVMHAWALGAGKISPPHVEVTVAPVSVDVVLIEELPPEPPQPVSAPPEPTEPLKELPPPDEEPVLSTPVAEAPPAPEPTPRTIQTPAPKKIIAPPASNPTPPKPSKAPQARSVATGAVTLAKPEAARNPPPRYPEFARKNGWEGRVMVRASVDSTGRVRSVSLASGSGYAVLDQSALQAVRTWKFRPKTIGGQPTESTVEVPVNFSLRR